MPKLSRVLEVDKSSFRKTHAPGPTVKQEDKY